jgi:hypothetical protein
MSLKATIAIYPVYLSAYYVETLQRVYKPLSTVAAVAVAAVFGCAFRLVF